MANKKDIMLLFFFIILFLHKGYARAELKYGDYNISTERSYATSDQQQIALSLLQWGLFDECLEYIKNLPHTSDVFSILSVDNGSVSSNPGVRNYEGFRNYVIKKQANHNSLIKYYSLPNNIYSEVFIKEEDLDRDGSKEIIVVYLLRRENQLTEGTKGPMGDQYIRILSTSPKVEIYGEFKLGGYLGAEISFLDLQPNNVAYIFTYDGGASGGGTGWLFSIKNKKAYRILEKEDLAPNASMGHYSDYRFKNDNKILAVISGRIDYNQDSLFDIRTRIYEWNGETYVQKNSNDLKALKEEAYEYKKKFLENDN